MVNRTLARRYAIAAASLAAERSTIATVGADLAAVARTIGERGAIYDFFVAPVVDRRDKERILAQAFEGKVDTIALHLLLLLVRKRRESLLGAIVAEYHALERAARGAEALRVTSARPLEPPERQALLDALERAYGKKFDVTQSVDPSVIGGLRLEMGDKRIDATVSGRLDALARELATTA